MRFMVSPCLGSRKEQVPPILRHISVASPSREVNYHHFRHTPNQVCRPLLSVQDFSCLFHPHLSATTP